MDKKQNKLSVCSINLQNLSGSRAVCVFMMSDRPGIALVYTNTETYMCPINPIFSVDVLYSFGLCPIQICQCSGVTVQMF